MTEQLKYFTFTKYSSLKIPVREQLFWLVNRLVSLASKGCDGLILGLLRQIKRTQPAPDCNVNDQRAGDLERMS